MVIAYLLISYNRRAYTQSNWACSNIKFIAKEICWPNDGYLVLASSLGAIIAGLLSGQATYSGISSMPDLFNKIAIISSIIGLVLILISKPLNNWVLKSSYYELEKGYWRVKREKLAEEMGGKGKVKTSKR